MIDENDYGDIMMSMDFGPGWSKCHSAGDLPLTASGDFALTKSAFVNIRQRMLLYFMTPKGERLESTLGCCLFDYIHELDTQENRRLFELALENDIRVAFPTLELKGIRVATRGNDIDNIREVVVKVILGNEDMDFLLNAGGDIQDISEQVSADVFKFW
jgi:hypothetical protein